MKPTPPTPNTQPKRRIAMVSTHGYVASVPPLGAADTGGQVVYVLELSKKLAQLGYEIDIWTRRFEDQPEMEPVGPGVRILRMPCGGRTFLPKEHLCDHLAEWSEAALRHIRREGLVYHFVNSHYWDAGVAARPLCRALGFAHIHTPHSLGLWKQRQMEADYPSGRAQFEKTYNFSRRIREERALYSEAGLVVATTPAQVDLLVGDYSVPAGKVRVAPPGCDDTRFYPVDESSREEVRRRLGFTGKVVLALGRLARNKGYDLLIDAFSLLAAREPEARLYFAIGGAEMTARERSLLDELQEQAVQSGHADRIHFGSFVPDEELADYYRAADLFVLSSRYEPFGMTAIEAMASGTPTVVTVHGGLYQALSAGCHALFADPFNARELGAAMAKIFRQSRLSARLSEMGSELARSLFSWTEIARKLVSSAEDCVRADLAPADDGKGAWCGDSDLDGAMPSAPAE